MEHTSMKLVRTLLTPFRVAGLLPASGMGESMMAATMDRRKVKHANPRADRVSAPEALEVAMKRYPTIIARLAK